MAKPRVEIAVLDRDKRRILQLQAAVASSGQFFLAGGTGLALRLGHRESQDLDWFTAKRFSVAELKEKLEQLLEKPTAIEQHGAQPLRAYYDDLETSFIGYKQGAGQTGDGESRQSRDSAR